MRRLILIMMVLPAFAAAASAQPSHYGMTDPVKFRAERDSEFRDAERSPLSDADREAFAGLKYYPLAENFAVKAAFTRTQGGPVFLMPTTGGDSKRFVRTGIISFELDGRAFQLTAYEGESQATDAKWLEEYGDIIFIPFRDRTSGGETYGTGRYIYIPRPAGDELVMDFNLAFNPSCAYQSKFSCPIPPKENFLDIEIRAGERNYKAAADVKPAADLK